MQLTGSMDESRKDQHDAPSRDNGTQLTTQLARFLNTL